MSVIQVNVWSCDFCGAVASTAVSTDARDYPPVEYPDGWGTKPDGRGESDGHACPECRNGQQPAILADSMTADVLTVRPIEATIITTDVNEIVPGPVTAEKIQDGTIVANKPAVLRGRVTMT